MPIFVSMIVWICLMRLLCSSHMKTIHLPGGSKGYKVSRSVSILTMGYIVFWIGMSSYMADSTAYILTFQKTSTDLSRISEILLSDDKGVLWSASVVLFKTLISADYQVWLMALSILMGFSVSACYRKYSEAFFFSMLLFVLSTDFSWMFNGIRQFVCVTALMLAFPWLIKGETKKYLLLIAILSQIHFTVLIMAPIYFVVRQKPWGKMVTLTIIGVCLMCAFISPFVGMMESALESTSYNGKFIISADDDGAHPIRVVILAIPAIFAWLSRKRIDKENNKVINICINLCLISSLLMLFAVFTSGIMMGRLAIYCSVYSAILLPMVINRWPDKSLRKLLQIAAVVFYCYYFYISTTGLYYYSIITGWID